MTKNRSDYVTLRPKSVSLKLWHCEPKIRLYQSATLRLTGIFGPNKMWHCVPDSAAVRIFSLLFQTIKSFCRQCKLPFFKHFCQWTVENIFCAKCPMELEQLRLCVETSLATIAEFVAAISGLDHGKIPWNALIEKISKPILCCFSCLLSTREKAFFITDKSQSQKWGNT